MLSDHGKATLTVLDGGAAHERLPDVQRSIRKQVDLLCTGQVSRRDTQHAVRTITSALIDVVSPHVTHKDVVSVPLLRAGLSMWEEANVAFSFPATLFLSCRKHKGTSRVDISRLGPEMPADSPAEIIILDPIVATGDTVMAALEHLKTIWRESEPTSITLLCCYASPQAASKLVQLSSLTRLVIGALAETVDSGGFLIPATHGDFGDKLFC
jgi:4a-hydroxytetrahydrobiopterin dehydratase